jgi:hypothetical protein
MAHDWMYATHITKGVVMMANRDGKYQEFIIEGDEFEECQHKWVERVQQYYDKLDK